MHLPGSARRGVPFRAFCYRNGIAGNRSACHDSNMNSTVAPSRRQLLAAVVKMTPAEYDAFVSAASARRAGVKWPSKAAREAALIKRVRARPARSILTRMQKLRDLARTRELTPAETRELEAIGELLENFSAERVRWVLELAGLRQSTFQATWKSVGLHASRARVA
jgi:hypothetical protein